MADCPVDENNLSFSDDEYDSMFLTQSTFRDVKTQDVVEAVEFMDNLGNFSCGDSPKVQQRDLEHVEDVQEFDWREHKDVQFFDFSNEVDNGCNVTSLKQGFIVKSHLDGSEIFVGDTSSKENCDSVGASSKESEVLHCTPLSYDVGTIGNDLKRFGPAVSEQKLDETKSKWWVKILVKIKICARA